MLLATPTTLIALLKAAAYGWRQERVADEAAQVAALGRELHERLSVFDEQLVELGRGLQRAVLSYNRAIGSLERRVLVSARKLGTLSGVAAVDGSLTSPSLLDVQVRGSEGYDSEGTEPERVP